MKTQTANVAKNQQCGREQSRAGFTLVELLVVIAVIAILAAFILPALGAARRRAQVARVTSEITSFNAAIAEFKGENGINPPSRLVLWEQAAGWNPNDPNYSMWQQDTRESRAILTRIWPQFDFGYTAPAVPGSAHPNVGELDIDGDGAIRPSNNGPIVLTGSECLVFFLGGMCATENDAGDSIVGSDGITGTPATPAKWVPLGFSNDSRFPFKRGGTRKGPYHTFLAERLVNINTSGADSRKMPEYLDPLPGQIAPYLYASAYEGRGYNLDTTAGMHRYTDINLGPANQIDSPLFIYLQSDPDTPNPYTTPAANVDVTNDLPFNRESYQIISAGLDGKYGIGGIYDPQSGIPSIRPSFLDPTTIKPEEEQDNITNFAAGMLDY